MKFLLLILHFFIFFAVKIGVWNVKRCKSEKCTFFFDKCHVTIDVARAYDDNQPNKWETDIKNLLTISTIPALEIAKKTLMLLVRNCTDVEEVHLMDKEDAEKENTANENKHVTTVEPVEEIGGKVNANGGNKTINQKKTRKSNKEKKNKKENKKVIKHKRTKRKKQ